MCVLGVLKNIFNFGVQSNLGNPLIIYPFFSLSVPFWLGTDLLNANFTRYYSFLLIQSGFIFWEHFVNLAGVKIHLSVFFYFYRLVFNRL